MRTTLTLDEDVAEQVKGRVKQSHRPFKEVINYTLRLGLEQMQRKVAPRKPYHTESHAMGVKQGYSLDNIQDLLSQIEGESAR